MNNEEEADSDMSIRRMHFPPAAGTLRLERRHHRAIVLAARNAGGSVVGIRDGYNGLLAPADYPQGWLVPLDRKPPSVRALRTLGAPSSGLRTAATPCVTL